MYLIQNSYGSPNLWSKKVEDHKSYQATTTFRYGHPKIPRVDVSLPFFSRVIVKSVVKRETRDFEDLMLFSEEEF